MSFCFLESNIAEVGEVIEITHFLQVSISFYTLVVDALCLFRNSLNNWN